MKKITCVILVLVLALTSIPAFASPLESADQFAKRGAFIGSAYSPIQRQTIETKDRHRSILGISNRYAPTDLAEISVQPKGFIAAVVSAAIAFLSSSAGQQTVNHIMQAKHLWSRVGASTWTQVRTIISNALAYGIVEKVVNGVHYITYKYAGQIVEVRGSFVNNVFRVSTAFVQNRG